MRYWDWQQLRQRTKYAFIGDIPETKSLFFSRNFSYHESPKVFAPPIISHKRDMILVQDWLWQPCTTSVGDNDGEVENQDIRVLSRETDVCLSNLTSQKILEQKMDQWKNNIIKK